jgi:ubiquinone biosynthesis monooxygenase Coq7
MYKTIAAVETFVDKHYQHQVDHLMNAGGPEGLLPVLLRCQTDEQHHRDQAAALGGDLSNRFIRAWRWMVGFGSEVAVALARRI